MGQRCFLSLIVYANTLAPYAWAQEASDETEIRAIVEAQVVAWDAGDGTAYAKDVAPFTSRLGSRSRKTES